MRSFTYTVPVRDALRLRLHDKSLHLQLVDDAFDQLSYDRPEVGLLEAEGTEHRITWDEVIFIVTITYGGNSE